jgi:cystathionine beta-lyase/cystathionine gamma-synthase
VFIEFLYLLVTFIFYERLKMNSKSHFFTKVIHSGLAEQEDKGAVIPPIYQTSTFRQEAPGVTKGYDYSRADNPTREVLESSLAEIEDAAHALAFSSGLAAEQAIVQMLDPGARVLVCDDVYGGTGRLFRDLYSKYSIEFEFIDMTDHSIVEQAFAKKVDMVWFETPSNPLLKVIDIKFFAQKSHPQAILVVDNTFASSCFQRPLALGADIVVHSSTKYLGGHSDVIGGAVLTNRQDIFDKLKFIQFAAGAVPSPFDCFLLLRSLKTLGVRMQQHEKNALAVAQFLESHPRVKKVYYPGLSASPNYNLAREQMLGFSGVVSFNLDGNYQDVLSFLSRLKVFILAESLGGVESLVCHPEKMTHASVPEDLRKKLGISESLLRLSVGIEDKDDLLADLESALSQI